ncbi:MAG: methyltransferase domain-containing protein [Myxococcota bacterium]
MPKSADESADMEEKLDDGGLQEESDVIELTDEVAGRTDDSEPSDEIDALTADMPEFKMPGDTNKLPNVEGEDGESGTSDADAAQSGADAEESPDADDEDGQWDASTQRLNPSARDTIEADAFERSGGRPPSAAILSRRGSDVDRSDADLDAEPDPKETIDERGNHGGAALKDAVTEDDNVEYDRQELVKTIQMEAIDRSKIEAAVEVSALADTTLLDSQFFAPDIVVDPPRVLTTRWTEGSPLASDLIEEARQRRMDSGALPEVAPDSEPKTEVEEELPDEEIEEIEAVEVEEADAEDKVAAKPPPKPAEPSPETRSDGPPNNSAKASGGPPPKKPAGPGTPAPAKQPPKQAKQAKKKPEAQKDAQKKGGEGGMSGLVQELLDEGKEPPRKKRKKKPEAWFHKIFNEEYLRTLPKDIHRQTKREVDFLERSLRINDDMRLLDLACGFGRHSIELTRRGFEVAGLDLSMPLLKKALTEAKKQSLSIKFIHGDMRDLNFDSIFDGCFLWQTSFGYFEDRVNLQVLRGINRALKPGGRLVVDVINRDHIVRDMPHRIWWEGVDCVFLEEVELDHNTSILHTKRSYIYEDGTPPLEQNSYIRLYSLHELRQLFRAAGFEPQEVSGELHHRGRYLGPSSSRIILMGRKRPPKS